MTVTSGTPGKPPAAPPQNGQNGAGTNGQHGNGRDEELATARSGAGVQGARSGATTRPVTPPSAGTPAPPTRSQPSASTRTSPPAPTRTPSTDPNRPATGGARPPTSAPSANPVQPRGTTGQPGQVRPAPANPFAPRPTGQSPGSASPAAHPAPVSPGSPGKKPGDGGSVPVWDPPPPVQPRQSLRERLGLGRKKDEELQVLQPRARPDSTPTDGVPTCVGAAQCGAHLGCCRGRLTEGDANPADGPIGRDAAGTHHPAPDGPADWCAAEPGAAEPQHHPTPGAPADPHDATGRQAEHGPADRPNHPASGRSAASAGHRGSRWGAPGRAATRHRLPGAHEWQPRHDNRRSRAGRAPAPHHT